MQRLIWVLFMGLLSQVSVAQSNGFPQKAISFEFLGHGLFYSFNYEHFLVRNEHYKLSARVGANYFSADFEGEQIPGSVFPVSVNSIFFGGKHHFEIDLGVMPYVFWNRGTTSARKGGAFPLFSPAYRLQPDRKSIFLKVSLTPWYFPREVAESKFFYWPGITFGYGF